jgi:D-alanyl-D-alanine carboxypeptidase
VYAPAGLHSARLALTPADLAGVQMGSATAYHRGWVYHRLVVDTAADAARLMLLLVCGRLLDKVTFGSLIEPHRFPDYRNHRHPDPAYGLGLMMSATDPELHPLGHSAEGPGNRIAVYAAGT